MVSMASILEADDLFLSRITSKQSCQPITHSSRIYYRNSNDKGVPFKWEMKPGKAIYQPEDELIPPLCPPPGATPLLPMRLHRTRSKGPFVFSKLWRKVLMKSKQNKVQFADHRMDSSKITIMSSCEEASSSGSSSSFSSNVRSNSDREFSDDGVITCAPWTYNPVMFCFAKRV